MSYFFTKLPPKYSPMMADIKCVSNGVITTPKYSLSITTSFLSIKNNNPLLNSVHVIHTEVSKNTGTIFGHMIIPNTADRAIILQVH